MMSDVYILCLYMLVTVIHFFKQVNDGSGNDFTVVFMAASSVRVMYRVSGPNTGSNPGGGQIQKKIS